MKVTVKQRVLGILEAAMHAHDAGMSYFYFQGPDGKAFDIPLHGGYIAQSYFCNPQITGSTEGKRRLRCGEGELQNEPWFIEKYILEGKWFSWGYGYRLKRKQATIQSQLQMAGR